MMGRKKNPELSDLDKARYEFDIAYLKSKKVMTRSLTVRNECKGMLSTIRQRRDRKSPYKPLYTIHTTLDLSDYSGPWPPVSSSGYVPYHPNGGSIVGHPQVNLGNNTYPHQASLASLPMTTYSDYSGPWPPVPSFGYVPYQPNGGNIVGHPQVNLGNNTSLASLPMTNCMGNIGPSLLQNLEESAKRKLDNTHKYLKEHQARLNRTRAEKNALIDRKIALNEDNSALIERKIALLDNSSMENNSLLIAAKDEDRRGGEDLDRAHSIILKAVSQRR